MPSSGIAAGPAAAGVSIEYNGFRFPKGAHTDSFTVEPVTDAAGRTVIYSRFRVAISAVLNLGAGATSDALAQNALSLLTQPAAGFSYRGRGLGDIRINLRGAQDCLWGPMPKLVSMSPRGADQTCRITWVVEFCIPTCGDARYFGPMEFSYETAIDVDRSGLANRTYKGFIRIAQTRPNQADRVVRKSADEWREKVYPPLLVGFRRAERTFALSADKCRLDFSIRDEELPGTNAPPPGVIEVEADHTYSTASPGNIVSWVGSLSATYEVEKGNDAGVSAAFTAFTATLKDRLAALRNEQPPAAPAFGGAADLALGASLLAAGLFKVNPAIARLAAAAAPAGVAKPANQFFLNLFLKKRKESNIVPVSFTVAEPSIYGKKRVRLEMKYRVVGATLAEIINEGGLWRPVPGAGWGAWATSLKIPFGARGVSGLKNFFAGEDEIVDLCARIPPDPPRAPTRPAVKDAELRAGRRTPPPVPAELRSMFPAPPADESWAAFHLNTRVETTNGTVEVKTLPAVPFGTPVTAGAVAGGLWGAPASSPSANAEAMKTHVQHRVSPTVHVFLEGYAVRVGFPVPPPGVEKVAGVAVTPVNRADRGEGFEQAVIGQVGLLGEIPVYAATWRLRYVLPTVPTGAPPVGANPLLTG